MKFIKLEILNLASLDRPEGEIIDFESGALGDSNIFSIVGPTGSGKSTILDAICLALYNRAPRYPRKKGDRGHNIEIYGKQPEGENNRLAPTDARNILTRGKKSGYSKLTFQANDGTLYRAEWWVRKRVRNYADAETTLYRIVTNDGTSSLEVAQWDSLPSIIGLEYEQFLRTVLIAQGSFSEFIKAKEEERYQLLEKLVGCEATYIKIAADIKEAKDEAVGAYQEMAARFEAQSNNLVAEEELEALKARITELEAAQKKAKEEGEQITKALGWFDTDGRMLKAIEESQTALEAALRRKAEAKTDEDRLALHDTTLLAVGLYREMKAAQESVAANDRSLNSIAAELQAKKRNIEGEEKNLETLKKAAKTAADLLAETRPRIDAARRLTTELDGLSKSFDEKELAKKAALDAQTKALQDWNDNEKEIAKNEIELKTIRENLDMLAKETEEEEKKLSAKAEELRQEYDVKATLLSSCDGEALQKMKSAAEKRDADLKSAIEICKAIDDKRATLNRDLERRGVMAANLDETVRELASLPVESLEKEVETLANSYTLMTSKDITALRSELREGEACPVCGSKHHLYGNPEAVNPVIDEMRRLLEEKRKELDSAREKQKTLTDRKVEMTASLAALDESIKTLGEEIRAREQEWASLKETYPEWEPDIKALEEHKPETAKAVEEAEGKLKEYNELVKASGKLQKKMEAAVKAHDDYEKTSRKKLDEAQKRVTDTDLLLQTARGKKKPLGDSLEEKRTAAGAAEESLKKVTEEIAAKTEALKKEIGDKTPDGLEKELTDSVKAADKAVAEKTEAVTLLRQQQTELEGRQKATLEQRKTDETAMSKKSEELAAWLSSFNDGRDEELTAEEVARLASMEEDWEALRSRLKEIEKNLTEAEATLKNGRQAHETHQKEKPEKTREELVARKSELDAMNHEELVEAKARFQRHETARQAMGEMLGKFKETETRKDQWKEIYDAIGSNGQTLRKIAQCYTLRFLIEHANAEIRKFNSRYELVQVKNSLGIRVVDHDRADDVRDTTTLSGGETFIVSLGLALGLSSLSSRNISFGNLFIDEGFGTLDPDTLATVIDSLAMLQTRQGKKVGVISHTDTMSERITTQIRLVKLGNSGSSRIELNP